MALIRANPFGLDNFQGMEAADPGPHLSRSTHPQRLQHFRPYTKYRLGMTGDQLKKLKR